MIRLLIAVIMLIVICWQYHTIRNDEKVIYTLSSLVEERMLHLTIADMHGNTKLVMDLLRK